MLFKFVFIFLSTGFLTLGWTMGQLQVVTPNYGRIRRPGIRNGFNNVGRQLASNTNILDEWNRAAAQLHQDIQDQQSIGWNNFPGHSPRLDNRPSLANNDGLPNVYRGRGCDKRIRVINGATRIRDKGTLARFQCSYGYHMLGASVAICVKGRWSDSPPLCVRDGCGKLPIPIHGTLRLLYGGGIGVFACNYGFQIEGERVLMCDGQRWNGSAPFCTEIPPIVVAPPITTTLLTVIPPEETPTTAEPPTESATAAEQPAESATAAETPTESPTKARTPTESATAAEKPTESVTAAEKPTESVTAAEAQTESVRTTELPTEIVTSNDPEITTEPFKMATENDYIDPHAGEIENNIESETATLNFTNHEEIIESTTSNSIDLGITETAISDSVINTTDFEISTFPATTSAAAPVTEVKVHSFDTSTTEIVTVDETTFVEHLAITTELPSAIIDVNSAITDRNSAMLEIPTAGSLESDADLAQSTFQEFSSMTDKSTSVKTAEIDSVTSSSDFVTPASALDSVPTDVATIPPQQSFESTIIYDATEGTGNVVPTPLPGNVPSDTSRFPLPGHTIGTPFPESLPSDTTETPLPGRVPSVSTENPLPGRVPSDSTPTPLPGNVPSDTRIPFQLDFGTTDSNDKFREYVAAISPSKLDVGGGGSHHLALGHLLIMAGTALVTIGFLTIVGGILMYCWKRNKGIARPHRNDMDGRTLSFHEGTDELIWFDPRGADNTRF